MILRLIRRSLIKFLLGEGGYFRHKLSLTPLIVGHPDRITIGQFTDLQDVILNANSGKIFIGGYTFCGHGVMILTGTHDLNLRGIARQQEHPTEGFDIRIGSGVWIGSGAIVLGGVTICDDSVIASGAIVTKSIVVPGVYAGCPARLVRELTKS